MDVSNASAATQHAVYEGDSIHLSIDEALRAQIEKVKAMLEASSSGNEVGVTEKPLFEILEECIPSGSPLKSFLDNRSKATTTTTLISNGGHAVHTVRTPEDIWNAVDETEPSRDFILVLRDIDNDWYEALCDRYPGSIDRKFLLQHIFRSDLELNRFASYRSPHKFHKTLREGGSTVSAREELAQLEAGLEKYERLRELELTHSRTESEPKSDSARLAADLTLFAIESGFEDLADMMNELWITDKLVVEAGNPGSKRHRRMNRQRNFAQNVLLFSIRLRMESLAHRLDSQTNGACGFHVDWWREFQSGDSGYEPYISRHDEFRRTDDGWVKPNAFVSCCRLSGNLYLALTSTNPSMRFDTETHGLNRILCIAPNFGSQVVVRLPDQGRHISVDDAVVNLIQQNWPVFNWTCTTGNDDSAWAQSQADGLMFASLLKATVLRKGLENEETKMRDLAYLPDAEDGAEHFTRLTDFRRVLARLHQAMGETKDAFKISAKAELHDRGLVLLRDSKRGSKQPATFALEEATEDSAKPQHSADFTKFHMQSLQELQERLDAIKEDLNEEIQLAIGSVQVHDAQTMKKQTTWTVVLTVLAAIYLPMTLVTGIFGMNITEISAEAKAPNAWWAFGAWAVVFVVTLGGILLYAVVRKWKARNKRKRKADLEANHKRKFLISRARNRAGGGPGKGVKRWARNFKRKTKKAWTSKGE